MNNLMFNSLDLYFLLLSGTSVTRNLFRSNMPSLYFKYYVKSQQVLLYSLSNYTYESKSNLYLKVNS